MKRAKLNPSLVRRNLFADNGNKRASEPMLSLNFEGTMDLRSTVDLFEGDKGAVVILSPQLSCMDGSCLPKVVGTYVDTTVASTLMKKLQEGTGLEVPESLVITGSVRVDHEINGQECFLLGVWTGQQRFYPTVRTRFNVGAVPDGILGFFLLATSSRFAMSESGGAGMLGGVGYLSPKSFQIMLQEQLIEKRKLDRRAQLGLNVAVYDRQATDPWALEAGRYDAEYTFTYRDVSHSNIRDLGDLGASSYLDIVIMTSPSRRNGGQMLIVSRHTTSQARFPVHSVSSLLKRRLSQTPVAQKLWNGCPDLGVTNSKDFDLDAAIQFVLGKPIDYGLAAASNSYLLTHCVGEYIFKSSDRFLELKESINQLDIGSEVKLPTLAHISSSVSMMGRKQVRINQVDMGLILETCGPNMVPDQLTTFSDWSVFLCSSLLGSLGRPKLDFSKREVILMQSCEKLLFAIATKNQASGKLPLNSYLNLTLPLDKAKREKNTIEKSKQLAGVTIKGVSDFSPVMVNPLTVCLECTEQTSIHYKIGNKNVLSVMSQMTASKYLSKQYGVLIETMANLDLDSASPMAELFKSLIKGYLPGSVTDGVFDELDFEEDLFENLDDYWSDTESDDEMSIDGFSDSSDQEPVDDLASILAWNELEAQMGRCSTESGCADVGNVNTVIRLKEKGAIVGKELTVRQSYVSFSKTFCLGSESLANGERLIAFVCDKFETFSHNNHSLLMNSYSRPAVGYYFYSFEVDGPVNFPLETPIPFKTLVINTFQTCAFMNMGLKTNWKISMDSFDVTSGFDTSINFRSHNGSFKQNMSYQSMTKPDWFFFPCIKSSVKFRLGQFCPFGICSRQYSIESMNRKAGLTTFALDYSETGHAGLEQLSSGDSLIISEASRKAVALLISVIGEETSKSRREIGRAIETGKSLDTGGNKSYGSSTRTVQSDNERLLHILAKSSFAEVEVNTQSAGFDASYTGLHGQVFVEVKTSESGRMPDIGSFSSLEQTKQQMNAKAALNLQVVFIGISSSVDKKELSVIYQVDDKMAKTDFKFDASNKFVRGKLKACSYIRASTHHHTSMHQHSCVEEPNDVPTPLMEEVDELVSKRLMLHFTSSSYTYSTLVLNSELVNITVFSTQLASLIDCSGTPCTSRQSALKEACKSFKSLDSWSEFVDSINLRQPKRTLEALDHLAMASCPSFNELVPISLAARTLSQWLLIANVRPFQNNRQSILAVLGIARGPMKAMCQKEKSGYFFSMLKQIFDNKRLIPEDLVYSQYKAERPVAQAAITWLVVSGAIVKKGNVFFFEPDKKVATFNDSAAEPCLLSASKGEFETSRMTEQPGSNNMRLKSVQAAANAYSIDAKQGFTTQQLRFSEIVMYPCNPVESVLNASAACLAAQAYATATVYNDSICGQPGSRTVVPGPAAKDGIQIFLTSVLPHMCFWYPEAVLGHLSTVVSTTSPVYRQLRTRVLALSTAADALPEGSCFDRHCLLDLLFSLSMTLEEITTVMRFATQETLVSASFLFRWLCKALLMSAPSLECLLRGITPKGESKYLSFVSFTISHGGFFTKVSPQSVSIIKAAVEAQADIEAVEAELDVSQVTFQEAVKASIIRHMSKHDYQMTGEEIEARTKRIMAPTNQSDSNIAEAIKKNLESNKTGTWMQYVRNFTRDLNAVSCATPILYSEDSDRAIFQTSDPTFVKAAASELHRQGQNAIAKLVANTHWALPDLITHLCMDAGMTLSRADRPTGIHHTIFRADNSEKGIQQVESLVNKITASSSLEEARSYALDLSNTIESDFTSLLELAGKTMAYTLLMSSGQISALLGKGALVSHLDWVDHCRTLLTNTPKNRAELYSVCRKVITTYVSEKFSSSVSTMKVGNSPGSVQGWQVPGSKGFSSLSYRADSQEIWVTNSSTLTSDEVTLLTTLEMSNKGTGPNMRPSWIVSTVSESFKALFNSEKFSPTLRSHLKGVKGLVSGPTLKLTSPQMNTAKTSTFRQEISNLSVFLSSEADNAFACVYSLSLLSRSAATAFEVNYLAMKMSTAHISSVHKEFAEALTDHQLLIGTRQLLRMFVTYFIIKNYSQDIRSPHSPENRFVSCSEDVRVAYIGNPAVSATDLLGYCQALQATGVGEAPGNVQVVQGTKKWLKELSALTCRDAIKQIIGSFSLSAGSRELSESTFILTEVAASFFFRHCPSMYGRHALKNRCRPSNMDIETVASASVVRTLCHETVNASRNAGAVGGWNLKSSAGVYTTWETTSLANQASLEYSEWYNSIPRSEMSRRITRAIHNIVSPNDRVKTDEVEVYIQMCRDIGMPDKFICPGSVKFTNIDYLLSFLCLMSTSEEQGSLFFGKKAYKELRDLGVFEKNGAFLTEDYLEQAQKDAPEMLRSLIFNVAHITSKRQKLGGRTIATQDVISALLSRLDTHIDDLSKAFKQWLPATDMATNDYAKVRDLIGKTAYSVATQAEIPKELCNNPIFPESAKMTTPVVETMAKYSPMQLYSDYRDKTVGKMCNDKFVNMCSASLTFAEFSMAFLSGDEPVLCRVIAHIADCARFSASDFHVTPNTYSMLARLLNNGTITRTTMMSLLEVLQRGNDNAALQGTRTMTKSNKGWTVAGGSSASWNQGQQTNASSIDNTESVTCMNCFCREMKSITAQSSDDRMGAYVVTESGARARAEGWRLFVDALSKGPENILAWVLGELDEESEKKKEMDKTFEKFSAIPGLSTYLMDISSIAGFSDSLKKCCIAGMFLEVIFRLSKISSTPDHQGSCIVPIPSNGFSISSSGSSINASSACSLNVSANSTLITALNVTKDTMRSLRLPSKAAGNMCNDWKPTSLFKKWFKGLRQPGNLLFLNPMIAYGPPRPFFGENVEMSSVWGSAKLLLRGQPDFNMADSEDEFKDVVEELSKSLGLAGERRDDFVEATNRVACKTLQSLSLISRTRTTLGSLSDQMMDDMTNELIRVVSTIEGGGDVCKFLRLSFFLNCALAGGPMTATEMATKQVGSLTHKEVLRLMRRTYGDRLSAGLSKSMPASHAVDKALMPHLPKQLVMQHKKNTEVRGHLIEAYSREDDIQSKSHSISFSLESITKCLLNLTSSTTQNYGINDGRTFGPSRILEAKDAIGNGTLSTQFTSIFNDLISGGLMIGTNMLGLNISNLTQVQTGPYPQLAWLFGSMSCRLEHVSNMATVNVIGNTTPLGLIQEAKGRRPLIHTRSAIGSVPAKPNAVTLMPSKLLTGQRFLSTVEGPAAIGLNVPAVKLVANSEYCGNHMDLNSLGINSLSGLPSEHAASGELPFGDSIEILSRATVALCPNTDFGFSGPVSIVNFGQPAVNPFTYCILPSRFANSRLENVDRDTTSPNTITMDVTTRTFAVQPENLSGHIILSTVKGSTNSHMTLTSAFSQGLQTMFNTGAVFTDQALLNCVKEFGSRPEAKSSDNLAIIRNHFGLLCDLAELATSLRDLTQLLASVLCVLLSAADKVAAMTYLTDLLTAIGGARGGICPLMFEHLFVTLFADRGTNWIPLHTLSVHNTMLSMMKVSSNTVQLLYSNSCVSNKQALPLSFPPVYQPMSVISPWSVWRALEHIDQALNVTLVGAAPPVTPAGPDVLGTIAKFLCKKFDLGMQLIICAPTNVDMRGCRISAKVKELLANLQIPDSIKACETDIGEISRQNQLNSQTLRDFLV